MSKVVRLIGHEYFNPSGDPMQVVSCLVMEIGEGDLRSQLKGLVLPCSLSLSVLRDVALALDQLHRSGVSHQDVKPSNVISMERLVATPKVEMKLGDLGRVIRKDVAGPFDANHWPGDKHYMPPERWYGYRPPEWPDQREASDAFMLGSLMFFVFTGVPIQPLLLSKLPDSHHPNNWRGGYDDTLKVVLQDAQARVIADHLLPVLGDDVRDGVIELAKQLTEPDPMLRGDPRARRSVGRPVGMDRVHQRLRELALRAAIQERVGKA
jgi:eukaryotic-like serine/threonine-protein kinase